MSKENVLRYFHPLVGEGDFIRESFGSRGRILIIRHDNGKEWYAPYNEFKQVISSEKNATFFCYSGNKGEFLFRGNCFEEELLLTFQNCEKHDYSEDKWFNILQEKLNTKETKHHDQDILDQIFRENVTIDYEFAEKLNMFDFITSDCFNGIGELGESILGLCKESEMRFIVSRRMYTGKQEIYIDFEVCHSDYENQCLKALIKQEI
ncbi:MAG: hypothetical protein EKK63_12765 [Acinetobacter sp.]|uniref:hypothetical protein n=1 Tax=Acinetobacter sp. TaxID=472 RepID=UPI000FAFFE70|nr:hypothetical protein [Acinetobacter sp.]RUP38246.1 MAG: hypothetical protein EKK63_12765 [Acinetobacter sp.]